MKVLNTCQVEIMLDHLRFKVQMLQVAAKFNQPLDSKLNELIDLIDTKASTMENYAIETDDYFNFRTGEKSEKVAI